MLQKLPTKVKYVQTIKVTSKDEAGIVPSKYAFPFYINSTMAAGNVRENVTNTN